VQEEEWTNGKWRVLNTIHESWVGATTEEHRVVGDILYAPDAGVAFGSVPPVVFCDRAPSARVRLAPSPFGGGGISIR
jgi:hypothetical protein